ncbi:MULTISPECIES: hypothetical protein [unclassified Streptomyces]|uniref:hypothetical protein n=1 Tax=unclassified Streptomyces TaxID=2593676 RepID=UPI001EB88B8D|nr:hypothetical protein [Streptomyces sp.]
MAEGTRDGTPDADQGADRLLPAGVISTARALVRTTVHACLEELGHGLDGGPPHRIRVAGRSPGTS